MHFYTHQVGKNLLDGGSVADHMELQGLSYGAGGSVNQYLFGRQFDFIL